MPDEFKDAPLDRETAIIEGRVLKNEALPRTSRAVRRTAKNDPDLEKIITPLKDTGYLEMSSQWLEQIEIECPDYYDALMARQDAISRLADTLVPSYAPIWEGHGGMTPGEAKRRAGRITSSQWDEARKSAEQASTSTVDYIAGRVDQAKNEARSGQHIELFSDTLDRVNKALKEEMEEGILLRSHRIEARQIGALTEGVWATLNAIDQERKLKPEMSLGLGEAIAKQKAYDKLQAEKVVVPQEVK